MFVEFFFTKTVRQLFIMDGALNLKQICCLKLFKNLIISKVLIMYEMNYRPEEA